MVSSRRHHRRLSILSKINLATATGSSWQYYKPFNSIQDQPFFTLGLKVSQPIAFNSIQDQLTTRTTRQRRKRELSILSKINSEISNNIDSTIDQLFQFYLRSTTRVGNFRISQRLSFNSIQDQLSYIIQNLLKQITRLSILSKINAYKVLIIIVIAIHLSILSKINKRYFVLAPAEALYLSILSKINWILLCHISFQLRIFQFYPRSTSMIIDPIALSVFIFQFYPRSTYLQVQQCNWMEQAFNSIQDQR